MLKRAWVAVPVLLVVGALSSCDGDQTPHALASGCSINSDCVSPLVCAFQRCHNECTSSRDCLGGARCVASDRPFRVCQLSDEIQCRTNADCARGMICGVDLQCRDQCGTDQDCIPGQVCTSGSCADKAELVDGGLPVATDSGVPATNRPCTYSSDCPEPLVCREGTCAIECRVDRDCPYFASCIDSRCRISGNIGGGGAGGTGRDGGGAVTGSGGAGKGGNGGNGNGGSATGSDGGVRPGEGPPEIPDCATRDTTGATSVSGDIATSQTWSGLIHVTGSVRVRGGAAVTIKPGTTIIVDTGSYIDFGYAEESAAILANGTANAPISFCGQVSDAGTWGDLVIENTVTASSVLANVMLVDGGAKNAALVLQKGIAIDNVQIRSSGTDGVQAMDFKAGSAALSVRNAAGVPVDLLSPSAVTHFPLGGAFEGNGTQVVRLSFSDVGEDTVYHDAGLPYQQTSAVHVRDSAKATFEAGVEMQFTGVFGIDVGYAGSGIMVADGTAANPVTFRGKNTDPGTWSGIRFETGAAPSSRLTHTVIEHAGGGTPALDVLAAITLADVSLEKNATGVHIGASGLDPASKNLSVTGTKDVPMSVESDALGTLPQGGTFTGNTTDEIDVASGGITRSATVVDLGVPYAVQGNLRIRSNSTLTLAPGTEFVMVTGSAFDVGYAETGGLVAKGTASAPIVFKGADPTTGSWDGIVVRSAAIASSAIDHVDIRNAGIAGSGAIDLSKEIAVTNSKISDSAGYGIRYSVAYTTNYATTNTFSNCIQGNVKTY
jgi:hypothetical protein